MLQTCIIIKLQKIKNMKKISFLFVAVAFVGFVSLTSCKSSTQPAETTEEVVVEEETEMVDTAAVVVDSAAAEVVVE